MQSKLTFVRHRRRPSAAAPVLGLWVLLAPRPAPAQELLEELIAPARSSHFFFGEELSIDGDTLVTGDPNSLWEGHPCQKEHGMIAVYKRNTSLDRWERSQQFRYIDDIPDQMRLGWSVSIRGNVVVAATPGQPYVDGATTIPLAGAISVYKRSTTSAPFAFAGHLFSPAPELAGEFTWLSDVATNGTYAAGSDYVHHPWDIQVYQVAPTLGHLTTINVPSVSPIWNMFITNQNVLVVNGPDNPAPFAYKLNGSQATRIDTSGLAGLFMSTMGMMVGDGDTVAWIARDGFTQRKRLMFARFDGSSATLLQSTSLPPQQEEILGAHSSPMALKENRGLFASARGGMTTFKYESGSYNYQGFTPLSHNLISMAFNGTDLFIGDRGQQHPELSECGILGSIFQYRANAPEQSGARVKLNPWVHQSVTSEGYAVARSGSFAAAGAPDTYQGGDTFGSVTLFRNTGGNVWEQVEQYMDGRNSQAQIGWTGFGYAVDLNSSFLAIGTPAAPNQVEASMTGGVQYARQLGGGVFDHGPYLQAVPLPPNVEAGEALGAAVALSGNTLFVGAPAWSVPFSSPNQRGSVYVYTWDSGIQGWVFRQKLTPNPARASDFELFGYRLAASGDNLIVGIVSRNSIGAAQIFRRNGSTGLYQSAGEFDAPPNLSPGAAFGDAVGIGGDFAAAGSLVGTVVTYRRTGTSWVQDRVITPGPFGFGYALSVEGRRLVVGSPFESRVHRYERTNTFASGVWNRTGTVVGSSTSFGNSVDLSGGAVTIGEPGALVGTRYSGASHVMNFGDIF